MADKADMENLHTKIERLCADYRAMKVFLDDSNGQPWVHDVLKLRDSPPQKSLLQELFRDVRESLQSGQSDALIIRKLIEVLDKLDLR